MTTASARRDTSGRTVDNRYVKMDARMVGVASAPTVVLVFMDSRGHSVKEITGQARVSHKSIIRCARDS